MNKTPCHEIIKQVMRNYATNLLFKTFHTFTSVLTTVLYNHSNCGMFHNYNSVC